MKYEYTTYRPAKSLPAFNRVRDELPAYVTEEFIKDERMLPSIIFVETRKAEIIEYLDNAFKVDTSFDCHKEVFIEIDADHVHDYSHFLILPYDLEIGHQAFCDIVRPTCPSDGCAFGSSLVLPVRIPPKKAKKIGIAKIGRAWGQPVELIVSSQLKKIFESERITGLKYEPCAIGDGESVIETSDEPPYLATIKNTISQRADDIVPEYMCEQHHLITTNPLMNLRIPRESVLEDDFLEIDSVKINDEVYYYHVHDFVISQRILELLLNHKIRGLCEMGFFLHTKFEPARMCDE